MLAIAGAALAGFAVFFLGAVGVCLIFDLIDDDGDGPVL